MFLMLLFGGCSGNHERDWPGSGSFYGSLDSGGECGVPAQNMFYVPAENSEQFWYASILVNGLNRIASIRNIE
jgi:hypothetical protein